MFTGLVEAIGTITARTARGPNARIVVGAPLRNLALGESISVNGVCLTVDTIIEGGFEVDASEETLAKTTLGALAIGARVNLERALTIDKRLGGHIVSGHVDGVGTLVSRAPLGDAQRLVFRHPPELARFIAPKGSITVDGISLTVNEVEGETFGVAIIPRTRLETRLDDVAVNGDHRGESRGAWNVNLEVDLLARYVVRALDARDV